MKKIFIELSEIEKKRIKIGYEGEQNHTQVIIRCGAFFAKYPDATAYMTVQTQTNLIYPVELEKDGSDLIWDVSPSDVSIVGTGKLQLTFTDGSGDGAEIIKSAHGSYDVLDSLDPNGDAPDPIANWIDEAEQTARQIAEESAIYAKEEIVESYGEIAPAIIETASGAIASFSDGADGMLVKTLEVQIDPVQDLHGQDSPWPGGGGKNLLLPQVLNYNSQGVTITQDGDMAKIVVNNATGYPFTKFGVIPESFPAGSYYLTIDKAITGIDVRIYDRTVSPAQLIKNSVGAFTIAEGHNDLSVEVAITGSVVTNGTYYLGVCVSSENTFTPYSNICPISGWDSANVSRTDVNIWDEEWETGNIDATTGQNTASNLRIRSKGYIAVKQNVTYNFYGKWFGLYWYDAEKHFIGWTGNGGSTTAGDHTFTVPNGVYYMRFRSDDNYGGQYNNDVSINYPATITGYHAYSGSTAEYEFPEAAGTVYGGTLTIHQDGSGELVVDRASKTNPAYTVSQSTSTYKRLTVTLPGSVGGNSTRFVANKTRQSTTDINYTHNGSSAGSAFVFIPASLSSEDIEAFMSDYQMVYILATTVTYQLTNQQVIALLKGSNNIWADTGDVAVEYPADTKLYIDGKVAELQALILENISNS